jgi:ribosomal protein S18 acetylase RimI-like enzyme
VIDIRERARKDADAVATSDDLKALMRPEEVEIIRTWSTAEGWNPGLHDGPCFFATDPGGFFIGELDGQPVSSISSVAYDDSFGFLGRSIVKPEFRGQGYGVHTWRAGMAHLGARNVGLDGVLAQRSNYERSGFTFTHHDIRYQGEVGGRSPTGVVRLADVPFEDVLAYDRGCFPAPRPTFLRAWLALPESVALGCLREGRLAGFGVARRGAEGFKIGPLLADDLPAAEVLLRGLTVETGGSFCLDAPDDVENASAGQLVGRFGMRELFRTARMYTQGRPRLDAGRVFGIASLVSVCYPKATSESRAPLRRR